MFKKAVVVLALAVVVCSGVTAFCAEVETEVTKEEVISIATVAVKDKGFKLDEVQIIYDEGGQLWSQKLGIMAYEDKSPNHGILKQGFLKNYRIVYFDFKEPLKDVWVFIDKDTGEVLTVHQE